MKRLTAVTLAAALIFCAASAQAASLNPTLDDRFQVRLGPFFASMDSTITVASGQEVDLEERFDDNAVTGAICTAGAAKIEGTVVYEMLYEESRSREKVRLGHPGGIITVGTVMDKDGDAYHYREAIVDRTARRLMGGYVYVPERHFFEV